MKIIWNIIVAILLLGAIIGDINMVNHQSYIQIYMPNEQM